MLRLAADLPDALILLDPVRLGRVGAQDQEPLGVVVDVVELVSEPTRRVEQLAVDVDLLLVPRAVADPDRAAVAPTGQV